MSEKDLIAAINIQTNIARRGLVVVNTCVFGRSLILGLVYGEEVLNVRNLYGIYVTSVEVGHVKQAPDAGYSVIGLSVSITTKTWRTAQATFNLSKDPKLEFPSGFR